MAITVRHNPSARSVSAAALIAGLGDYNQRQQQLALEQQRMQLQDLMQRRGLAANMASQQHATQARFAGGMMDQAFALQRMGVGDFFDAQQQARAEDAWGLRRDREEAFRREMLDTRSRLEAESAERDAALRRRELAERADISFAADAVKEERERIRQGLANGTLRYTPQQKQRLNELQGDLSDIETRDDLDPQQKMEARIATLRAIDAIRPTPVPEDERPKTFQDQVAGRWGDLGNGMMGILQPDGKMEVRPLPKDDQSKVQATQAKSLADARKALLEIRKEKAAYIKAQIDAFAKNFA